jgi:cytosine permease
MSSELENRAIKALDKLYEFEHEPVSEDKLQPGRHFAGMFAGEHVAGTEFVIGALFVAWGVNAFDIFVGLLIGNALAVLTWTFVCAPIAVQTRLTLYWYLRKIAGPVTTTIYNILNAILFCILAGCMITVSASAVRIPLGIPAQTNWYPQDFRFVLVVIVVGAVVVTLAILGFKRLAQFSEVCSPWMFLMFIAGAIAMFPFLAARADVGKIQSFGDLVTVAKLVIWTGKTPAGTPPISFWQVTAFAWICNLAMHGGLSDMAILRYAKKASYGLHTAFGMYLGHYLAWICAGVMGAAAAMILNTTISKIDAGEVATQALGVSGIIAVVLAGWTTSNPTLYRAGLAFQAVTPGWPRWLVTLVAGIATTAVACFPFVFTKLLDFVGYYGLLLMPVGAIVFVEHWIFPKIGFTQFWVSKKKLLFSWPALLSWGLAIAVAIVLEQKGIIHLLYLFVPVWILTSVLYIIFAGAAGARETLPELAEDKKLIENIGASAIANNGRSKIRTSSRAILWISGILALASLIACFVMPLWVYAASAGPVWEQRFETFKTMLIWPSLIYFIFGTIWYIKWEQSKQP